MDWMYCPYPNCRRQHAPFGGQLHVFDPQKQHGPYLEEYSARWRHSLKPCCEWCKIWEENGLFWEFIDPVTAEYELESEANFQFPILDPVNKYIIELWLKIHRYYKRHRNTDSLTIVPSIDVEKMSRALWKFYRDDEPMRRLSRELKNMAIELQIGRPRKLYFTMPRPVLALGW